MSASLDIQKFIKSLQEQVQPRAKIAAEQAVDRFANHVLGEAQELCPIDTGALKASATAGEVQDDDGLITQEIGFNTSYAAAVHEILTNHHPNGQAKFLETAMQANADKLKDYVIDAIKKELGT